MVYQAVRQNSRTLPELAHLDRTRAPCQNSRTLPKLAHLARRLDVTSAMYGMEMSAEKINVIASNNMTIPADMARI